MAEVSKASAESPAETAKTATAKPEFTTSSGIPVERVYRAEDLRDFDAANELGEPGEFPFTRGIQPAMYRARLWTMRQYGV
jgi:methylmalonyl-CoA mutase N-terminal domain/subunit